MEIIIDLNNQKSYPSATLLIAFVFLLILDVLPFTYGSIKSNRKASCDVKSLCSEGECNQLAIINKLMVYIRSYVSVGLGRRQSFAKFHAMTIEAPITKVCIS